MQSLSGQCSTAGLAHVDPVNCEKNGCCAAAVAAIVASTVVIIEIFIIEIIITVRMTIASSP